MSVSGATTTTMFNKLIVFIIIALYSISVVTTKCIWVDDPSTTTTSPITTRSIPDITTMSSTCPPCICDCKNKNKD